MGKMEICPVCGYDRSRDIKGYPALARLGPESRLLTGHEEKFVLSRGDMSALAGRLAKLQGLSRTLREKEEIIRRLQARVDELEQLLARGVQRQPDMQVFWTVGEGVCLQGDVGLPEGMAVVVPAEVDGQPVTRLADFALADASVGRVELPEGMEEIGQGAFSGCGKLSLVQFRRNLRKIGKRAFAGCVSLEQIALPKRVTVVETETFAGCTSLRQVQLPSRLRRIERGAFAGCTALRELRVPAGVERIDPAAFAGCEKLARLSLPGKMRGKPLPRLPEDCRVEYRGV